MSSNSAAAVHMAAHHTSGMPIDPWLPRAAAQHPERVALEAPEGALTYAQLLEAAGIDAAPGSRVALSLPPGLDFAVALHACLLARAAAVPVDPRLGAADQAALLASADLVVDGPLPAGGAPQPVVAPRDGDTALVVHTSGTTAAPRVVELSFGNIQANALGSAVALGLDPDERWLCPLPLSHVGGLMVLLRSAVYGTRAVIDGAERAGADDITVVSLVPTQLRRLRAHAGLLAGRRRRAAAPRAGGHARRRRRDPRRGADHRGRRDPAYRRPRPLRRGRPPGDRRPQVRHDRQRRRERRARGGRGGAARPPGRGRRRRLRPP